MNAEELRVALTELSSVRDEVMAAYRKTHPVDGKDWGVDWPVEVMRLDDIHTKLRNHLGKMEEAASKCPTCKAVLRCLHCHEKSLVQPTKEKT